MLENTYENTPKAHEALFSSLNSPHAQFCLDVGHLMSFAKTPWQNWLPKLTPWLGQLHLHDNDGTNDQHLGLGLGNFHFKEFFTFLSKNNLHPIVTLEPHSEDDLWQTLEFLDDTGYLDQIS